MKKKIILSIFCVICLFGMTGCDGLISENNHNFSGTGIIYRNTEDNLKIGDSIKDIDYTTDATELNGRTYLKHEVEDFVITKNYVCFVTDKEYCLEGSETAYDSNVNILRENDQWFHDHNGGCIYGSGSMRTYCLGDNFTEITPYSVDDSLGLECSVNVTSASASCY